MDMGAKIRDVQILRDGEMLKTVSRSDYEYQTGIPKFVDSIAIPRINEIMKEYEWKYDTLFYIDGQKYQLVKWKADDGVEIEVDGKRIMKINKKYFRELYEKRDR